MKWNGTRRAENIQIYSTNDKNLYNWICLRQETRQESSVSLWLLLLFQPLLQLLLCVFVVITATDILLFNLHSIRLARTAKTSKKQKLKRETRQETRKKQQNYDNTFRQQFNISQCDECVRMGRRVCARECVGEQTRLICMRICVLCVCERVWVWKAKAQSFKWIN